MRSNPTPPQPEVGNGFEDSIGVATPSPAQMETTPGYQLGFQQTVCQMQRRARHL